MDSSSEFAESQASTAALDITYDDPHGHISSSSSIDAVSLLSEDINLHESEPLKVGSFSKISCTGYPIKSPNHLLPKCFGNPRIPWSGARTPETNQGTDYYQIGQHIGIFLIVLIVLLLPPILILILAYPYQQSQGTRPFYDCSISRKFTFQGIDMPIGKMSFSQAKAIDLFWNAIVGRMLQTLYISIAYRTFTNILMQLCEQHHVKYSLFTALSLATTRLSTIKPLLESFSGEMKPKFRLMFFWFVITIIYLILFPTMIDAVTGYQSYISTQFKFANGTSSELSQLSDYKMQPPSDPSWYNYTTVEASNGGTLFTPYIAISDLDNFTAAVGGPVAWHGYYVFRNDNGVFYESEVNIWCLDTTTSALFMNEGFNEWNYTFTYQDSSCINWYPLQNRTSAGIPTLNETYFLHKNNFQCVPKSEYSWGFSYAFLLVVSLVNGVWILGTWLIWLISELGSELVTKGRHYGTLRAVVDLSEAIQKELGPDICGYSDDQLKKALQGRPPIKFNIEEKDSGVAHIALSSSTAANEKFCLEWDREYGRACL